MAKKNDWVATMLFNQPSSMDEILANGVTPDNTGIQSKDYYKNIDAVQQTFKDQNGEFDNVAFDNFYNSALSMYNKFSTEEWTKKLVSEMDRDPFDWTQPLNTNVKNISATVMNGNNPERRSMSITGIGSVGDPTFSIREIAQASEVMDENGNKLGWTPNQKGIMSIFEPTVALATWDEDGMHEENGMQVMHKKGDYKTNEFGDYFYETLGDREAYDKEILRVTDVLTTDGSTMNKFDFMDSDGLTKSVGSVIGKTFMQIAPLLIPGVREVYGTVSALTTLASVLPTLGKSINGILGGDNNGVDKSLTQLENWFGQFKPTQSDKGKSGFFTLENIGEMMTSSAKQLYQQKSLANLAKVINSNDALRASNWGQRISLGYLAVTSSQDTYADFKRAGASDATAGLGMLASMAALYGMMDNDYFKDWLFKGTFMDDSEALDVIKAFNREEISKIHKSLGAAAPDATDAMNLYEKMRHGLQKKWTKFVESPFAGRHPELVTKSEKAWGGLVKTIGRSVNEGVEETMEEVIFDAVKGVTSALDALGLPMGERGKNLDFGFSLEDMLTRYASSFVGGALGGAVFEGLNSWERTFGPKIVELSDLEANEQMSYLIMTGRANELRDKAKVLYEKGKLGDKNLSASADKTVTLSDGTKVFGQGDENDNQNLAAYNAILMQIDYVEAILAKHGMNLMMDQFAATGPTLNEDFQKAAEAQDATQRKEGIDENEYLYRNKSNALLAVFNARKFGTSYVNEVVKLGNDFVTLQSKINALEADIPKAKTDAEKEVKHKQLEFYNKQLTDLQKQRDDLLNGVGTDRYVHEALFTTSKALQDNFLGDIEIGDVENAELIKGAAWSGSIEGYVKSIYGKNYHELENYEKEWYKAEFDDYKKTKEQDRLRRASRLHYKLIQDFNGSVKAIEDKLKDKTRDHYHDHSTINAGDSKFNIYEHLTDFIADQTVARNAFKSELDKYIESWDKSKGDISEDDEYIKRAEELARMDEEIEKTKQTYETLHLIYGENADTAESITEEGQIKLYDEFASSVGIVEMADELLHKLDLVSELEDKIKETSKLIITVPDETMTAEEFDSSEKAGLEVENLTKQRDALLAELGGITRENVLATRAAAYEALLDLVKDYYSEMKKKKVVSSNDLILKRVLNIISSKMMSQIGVIPVELEVGIDESMEKDLRSLNTIVSDKIKEYLSRLNLGEISEAASVYGAAVSIVEEFINEKGLSDNAEEIVKNAFVEQTFGLDLQDFVTDINDIKSEITPFSVIDLIHNAEVAIGKDVFKVIELLEREDASFIKSTKLDPYLINNPQNLKALQEIPRVLRLVTSIFESSWSGLNDALNAYRKGDQLVTISSATKDIVASDISYLGAKTITLLNKHKANSASKSGFHKTSEIKIKTDFVKNLLFKREEKDSFIKRLNTHFFGDKYDIEEDINKLAETYNIDLDKLDETSDFVNFNTFFIKLGDLIYDMAHKHIEGDDVDVEIGTRLAKLIPSDAYKLVTGKITDDSKAKLTDWSTVVYMGTLLATRASDFWKNLVTVESAHSQIVPIIGQQWNIQVAYANAVNPKIFNEIVTAVGNQNPKGEIGKRELTYLTHRSILKNFTFIQGGAGSGKTQVVAKFLTELLKMTHPDIAIAAAAPEDTQIKGISNALGTTSNYMFSDLMDKIHPEWRDYEADAFTDSEHQAQLKEERINIKTKSTAIFAKDAKTKILVIDEATLLSERELQILSKWAQINNVQIIALGDRKQNSKREEIMIDKASGKTKAIDSGIEDCVYISGPELTESIRANNIAQANNLRDLTITINRVLDVWRDKPWLDADKIDELLNKIKDTTTILQYTEVGDEIFAGQKFIQEEEVEEYIERFLNISKKLRAEATTEEEKRPSVLLITDTPSKYSALDAKGLTVLTSEKAQGGEYDFVIIDKDFGGIPTTWGKLKDFYTCISRSRYGSVISGNRYLKKILGLEDHDMKKSGAEAPISFADNSDDLRKWKAEILKNIVETPAESTGGDSSTDGTDSSGESDGKPTETPPSSPPSSPSPSPGPSTPPASKPDGGADYGKEDDPFSGTFDTGAKPELETHSEDSDDVAVMKAAVEKSADKVRKKLKSEAEGKMIAMNRPQFLDLMSSIIASEDTAKYSFVKLFSSAILFNLEIKQRHVDKLYDTGFNRDIIDQLVYAWNNNPRRIFEAVEVDDGMSVITYVYKDYKIPIAIVEGKVEGTLFCKKGEIPFKQVTKPIRISGDRDVKLTSSLTHGSVYSGSRIFAPTESSPEPVGKNKYKNSGFKKSSLGKTFTVWSECDILTDEDFEEMFQYQHTDGKVTNYTNTKGFFENEVDGTTTVVHELHGGGQGVLINIHRSCSIADIYDILCIARFACGRLAYSDLTNAQKTRLGGKNNRMDAIRYMRNILGDFGYNLLDSSDDKVRRSELAKSLQDLKSKYRLLAKNSQPKLLGNFYLAFEGLKAEHPTWYHGFVENVFKCLQTTPVSNSKKSTIYQNCLLIKQLIGKETVTKIIDGAPRDVTEYKYAQFLAKFDPSDNSYHIFRYEGFKALDEVGVVSAKGTKLQFSDIIKSVIPSIDSEEKLSKALQGNVTMTILKESKKYNSDGSHNTYYDTADDYDYIFALLNGIKTLDLNKLDSVLKNKYYKNGFYLNDIGSVYQVGAEADTNDATKSAWRINDTTSDIPWSSDTAMIVPSQFELVGDFTMEAPPTTETEIIEEAILEEEVHSEFSLFEENLLNLQNNGQISEFEEDELKEMCQKLKDDPSGIDQVLAAINEREENIWSWSAEDGLSSVPNPEKAKKVGDNKTRSCEILGLDPEETGYTPILNVSGQRWILRNDVEDATYLCTIADGDTEIQILNITEYERLWKSAGFSAALENVNEWEDELLESDLSDEDYNTLDQLLGFMTNNSKLPKCD